MSIDYNEKVLEVKNLKKYFYSGIGKKRLVIPAVDNVSFDIYKREVLGLVGESGCGKTTTGRTLIKIYNPTDGSVKFNGVDISAGSQTNLDNIKNIKIKLKNDIRILKPNGKKILEEETKLERKSLELNYELAALKEKHKNDLLAVNKPINDFKSLKYETKNQYNLNIEGIEFDINERRKNLIKVTINNSQIEYDREIRMAKLYYQRSLDGLKSSAALEKVEIERRLKDLKKEHDEKLIKLAEKYDPLIAEDEGKRKHKRDIKDQLAILKLELKERKAEEKERYRTNVKAIKVPDYQEVRKQKELIIKSFKEKRAEIKRQIIEQKALTKETVRNLTKEIELSQEDKIGLKDAIKKLKEIAKENIQKEKFEISKVKKINRSAESIEEIKKMQMIFQDPISSLNPRMTVREIVAEGLIIQGGFAKSEIDKKVREVLELVGLAPEFMARYPHEFSGGQRQRIGVARALIMEPNLVIADEPVSALDVSVRAQVINLLRQLKEDLDLTILFIAHDLSIVEFFCDRIAVMYYGKIVELAPSKDLFKNPLHPYTKSLLSAVPQPDPDYEKGRKRIFYDPRMHDYRFDKPTFRKIGENHFVLANEKEFAEMEKIYQK